MNSTISISSLRNLSASPITQPPKFSLKAIFSTTPIAISVALITVTSVAGSLASLSLILLTATGLAFVVLVSAYLYLLDYLATANEIL